MTKLNIVIPMAGEGSRFVQAGYKTPKPFIDVNGLMMIERVLDNLKYDDAHYILIARKEHLDSEPERKKKIEASYNVTFITIEELTLGAACTVLASHLLINNNTPLLIANSDQIVEMNIANFINDSFSRKLDGSILTFEDNNPKWSFAKLNAEGLVVEVKEKQPISNFATVGIYFFNNGQEFINATIDMIVANDTTNNEFYVAPIYNYLVKQSKKIGIYNIEKQQMFGTGTPEDLDIYLKKLEAQQVA